jgi:hypothetical protein
MYPVGKISERKESLLAGDTVCDLDRADVGRRTRRNSACPPKSAQHVTKTEKSRRRVTHGLARHLGIRVGANSAGEQALPEKLTLAADAQSPDPEPYPRAHIAFAMPAQCSLEDSQIAVKSANSRFTETFRFAMARLFRAPRDGTLHNLFPARIAERPAACVVARVS